MRQDKQERLKPAQPVLTTCCVLSIISGSLYLRSLNLAIGMTDGRKELKTEGKLDLMRESMVHFYEWKVALYRYVIGFIISFGFMASSRR